jgi:hypothetical protein
MPPFLQADLQDKFDTALLVLTNSSEFYRSIGPEQARTQNALILDTEVCIGLDSDMCISGYKRFIRQHLTRFTEALNLHYDLLTYVPKKETIMPTGIELTNEEASAPLANILVCAGKRLDEMSESDMVHHLKNFQDKIDKLKALKVSSKKIKSSIKNLEEQVDALVEAYDSL